MDDDTEQDLATLMQRTDGMNAEQRVIVGGVLATLQAFDDDDAAGRWIARHKQSIVAELKRAQ